MVFQIPRKNHRSDCIYNRFSFAGSVRRNIQSRSLVSLIKAAHHLGFLSLPPAHSFLALSNTLPLFSGNLRCNYFPSVFSERNTEKISHALLPNNYRDGELNYRPNFDHAYPDNSNSAVENYSPRV